MRTGAVGAQTADMTSGRIREEPTGNPKLTGRGFISAIGAGRSSVCPTAAQLTAVALRHRDGVGTTGTRPSFRCGDARTRPGALRPARILGPTRYPNGAPQFTVADWVTQYGESWSAFGRAKQKFHPGNIITTGPGIF
jgi:Cytokinin dehydrogenase 1, FAD and cytokinin binding